MKSKCGKIIPQFHTIRKVQKFNFDKNPNIFTSFSPKIFLTIFLVKSKLSTAKKSKTAAFSWVFQPKQFDNFSREIKAEFWDKKWRFRTVWASSSSKKKPVPLCEWPYIHHSWDVLPVKVWLSLTVKSLQSLELLLRSIQVHMFFTSIIIELHRTS